MDDEENPFVIWTDGRVANQIEASPRNCPKEPLPSPSFFRDEPPSLKRISPFKKLLPRSFMSRRSSGSSNGEPGEIPTPPRAKGVRMDKTGESTSRQSPFKSVKSSTSSTSANSDGELSGIPTPPCGRNIVGRLSSVSTASSIGDGKEKQRLSNKGRINFKSRRSSVSTIASNGEISEIQSQLETLQAETAEKSLCINRLEKQLDVLRETAPSDAIRISETIVATMEMENEINDLKAQLLTSKQQREQAVEERQRALSDMTQHLSKASDQSSALQKTVADQTKQIDEYRNEINGLDQRCVEQTNVVVGLKNQLVESERLQLKSKESNQDVTKLQSHVEDLQTVVKERNKKIAQLEASLASTKAITVTQAGMIDQMQLTQSESSTNEEHRIAASRKLELLQEQLNKTKERVMQREEEFLAKIESKQKKLANAEERIKALEADLAKHQKPENDETKTAPTESENEKHESQQSDSLQAVDRVPSMDRATLMEPSKQGRLNSFADSIASPNTNYLSQASSHVYLRPKKGKPVFSGTADFRKSKYHKWKPRHAILFKCKDCYQLRLMSPDNPSKRPFVYNLLNAYSRVERCPGSANHHYTLKLTVDMHDSKGAILIMAVRSEVERSRWYQAFHGATSTGSLGDDLTEIGYKLSKSWSSSMGGDLISM